ncbi:MAG: carboxypeptidase regulatory-like domain-containing protein [Cytophagaceae bacterium]|jgi:murein tripeptide amidase MpaA|nr:carboxypeptidase regulatory-like domain-containing protein [Cytophagaceae bacterium]
MNRITLLLSFVLLCSINIFSQTSEYYLSIEISDRAAIDELTRIVSIDRVSANEIIAYANDTELAKLQKTGYRYRLLEHPSASAAKSITMATSVEQMANWDRYPTYDVYCELMQKFENDYPDLCKAENIGTSVQNRIMWALKISNDINTDSPKPEIMLSSTMHGDETTGWILCMRLADYLLTNYGDNERVTAMLDSMTIYILPNTNPDGTYYGGNNTVAGSRRYNLGGIDLNRDYPDPREGANSPYAKETQVMMDFADNHHFILANNYHGGAELINYPWDTWRSTVKKHADHNWYMQKSREYATTAQQNSPSGYFTDENNGITNGGDWYVVAGGRQDYMNWWHHCREFTTEISYVKLLAVEQLNAHWDYQRDAMLNFIENINQGIKGIVINEKGEPVDATITIVDYDIDNSHAVTNPAHGDYYRMLLPGTYTLLFESYEYFPQTITDVVVEQNATTRLNVTMLKEKTYTITGAVTNSETDEPLEGVTVTIPDSPNEPVITDAEGNFTFVEIPKGNHSFLFAKTGYYRVDSLITVDNDATNLNIALASFTGFSFESGKIPNGFTLSGDANWFVTDAEAYDGVHSLRTGVIGNNQSTTLQYTFDCANDGDLAFHAKISTETGGKYDYLEFFIDDESVLVCNGEIDWQQYTFPLTAGIHTLTWKYTRDKSIGGKSDAIWIDFVSFPEQTSAIATKQLNQFRIHPNPAKDNVTVSLGKQQSARLEVHTVTGYKLYELLLSESETILNLSEIGIHSSGIFMFWIKTDDGAEVVKVMVK